VRKIAVDRGLIAADANLSNEETDNLIFLPGFSTADSVSDISGRGVGMDVVRRSIQQLGGRISIASTPGKGSVFTMSLPLTLAVLDGMVVRAGGQTLLSPLSSIIESFTPKEGDLHRIGARDWVIRFRERFLPLIDTGRVLGFSPPDAPAINGHDGIAIVVENEGGSQVALWVDDIQGQRQVVIKSLETNYRKVDGISAATILGDGRVALILDIDALVILGRQQANQSEFKIAS
jgi:two-component system chemotaxis sensor kinase CheA